MHELGYSVGVTFIYGWYLWFVGSPGCVGRAINERTIPLCSPNITSPPQNQHEGRPRELDYEWLMGRIERARPQKGSHYQTTPRGGRLGGNGDTQITGRVAHFGQDQTSKYTLPRQKMVSLGIQRKSNLRGREWGRGIAYLLVMYANVMDLWAVHASRSHLRRVIHKVSLTWCVIAS